MEKYIKLTGELNCFLDQIKQCDSRILGVEFFKKEGNSLVPLTDMILDNSNFDKTFSTEEHFTGVIKIINEIASGIDTTDLEYIFLSISYK